MHQRLGQSRPRAVRLATVALAVSDRPVTLAWLRSEVGLYGQSNAETGRMQFERDKRELVDAGVPIEEEAGVYRVTRAGSRSFTEDELDALTTVSALVGDPDTGAALAAFAGPAEAYPDTHLDDRILSAVPEAPELAAAIADERAVSFDYRPANGPLAERHVEPWGLRARRGLWYVIGHDRDRDDHRHFRLDRIVGGVDDDGDAHVERPAALPTDLLPPDAGPVTLRLIERGYFEAHRLGADLDPPVGPAGPPSDREPSLVRARVDDLRDAAAVGFALAHDALIDDPAPLEEDRRVRAAFVADLHSLPAPTPPAGLTEAPGRTVPLTRARIRRLLALPGWLAQRVEVTVEEACRGFGVEPDELEEDLAVLRDVVLPGHGDVVDTEVEADGTIRHLVAVGVPLRLDPLDRARVRSLLTATASLDVEAEPGVASLVRRLDAPAVAVATEEDQAVLARLHEARAGRRIVTALHRSRSGDVARRRFTPTRLDWQDGRGYVGGWDHDRGAARWFRLDRLADITIVEVGDGDPGGDAGGDAPDDVDLEPVAYVPQGEEITITVRCTHVGTWVLNRIPPVHRLDLDDGTVWAVIRTDAPRMVLDQVVVAAGEAEVVAPAELRTRVAERSAQVS